jgi:hypothetical protein
VSALITVAATLQHLDLIVIRAYSDPEVAGWYAGAATVGTLLFNLGSPVCWAVYARALHAFSSGQPAFPALAAPLAAVFIGGSAGILATGWLGTRLAEIAFGTAFGGAGDLMPAYLAKTTAVLGLLAIGLHAVADGRPYAGIAAACPALLALAALALLRPTPPAAAIMLALAAIAAAACASLSPRARSLRPHGINRS